MMVTAQQRLENAIRSLTSQIGAAQRAATLYGKHMDALARKGQSRMSYIQQGRRHEALRFKGIFQDRRKELRKRLEIQKKADRKDG